MWGYKCELFPVFLLTIHKTEEGFSCFGFGPSKFTEPTLVKTAGYV